jgi:transcriptional regulator
MGKSHLRPAILPGTLELLILKTLARNKSLHGAGIAEAILALSGDVLRVEEGSLYPALQRLMLEGWIAAEWGQSDNNRRARYYTLTPAGRKRMRQEISGFEHLMEAVFRVIRPA